MSCCARLSQYYRIIEYPTLVVLLCFVHVAKKKLVNRSRPFFWTATAPGYIISRFRLWAKCAGSGSSGSGSGSASLITSEREARTSFR